MIEFTEDGGNLLIGVDEDVSDKMRTLAAQVGVEFDDTQSRVIDHFSYDPATDDK